MLDVLIAPGEGLDEGAPDVGMMDAQTPDMEDFSLPIPQDVSLTAGRFHTCALARGALYCWGSNEQGSLGVGDTARREAPTRVGQREDWVRVRAALNSTCALDARGQVFCWGDNGTGQIGSGQASADALVPTHVDLPHPALDLDTGSDHVCAVLQTGELYCWGSVGEGRLGPTYPEGSNGVAAPTRIDERTDWREVATGEGHTCGLRAGGELYCWGRNTRGMLGVGEGTSSSSAITRVGSQADWVTVRASQNGTCAVRGGALFCWGANGSGQIDVAITQDALYMPTLIGPLADDRAFALGPFGTCRVDPAQTLLCRGRNREGQLSLSPDPADAEDPDARAETVLETPRARVTMGWFHICSVDAEDAVWCRGRNLEGQLGGGDLDYVNTQARQAPL